MHEADPPFGLGHVGKRVLIGNARSVLIAKEFHVSAEWNSGQLPSGAVAIIEADEFGAKSDRKGQYPDTAPAGDQKMAELVEEDHDGQYEQKGNEVAEDAPTQRADSRKKIETHDAMFPAPHARLSKP